MQTPRRPVGLTVNQAEYPLFLEPRRTLLDALREDLAAHRHQEGLRHG